MSDDQPGIVGPHADLSLRLYRAGGLVHAVPAEVSEWLARVGHDAVSLGSLFQTELHILHLRPHPRGDVMAHGKRHQVIGERHLGSGLITNAGVNVMANDFSWAGAATPFSALSTMNYHGVGTGTTAAAATDFGLQTPVSSANLTGSTNGYYTGTQSCVAPNIYQTVATIQFAASLSITEWALFSANGVTITRTAAGAAPTATTFTDTGASYATSGNGLKAWSIEIASSSVNTPTSTGMGLITSNTGTVLTIANGWWTLANASSSTPGASAAYTVAPTAWDHKVFSVINVNSGDSLQATEKITVQSGG